MLRYRAYGMRIGSEMELPELLPDSPNAGQNEPQQPDLSIRFGSISQSRPDQVPGTTGSWATPREVLLHFDDAGRFLIRGGNEILIDRAAGAQDIAMRLFLLGPVIATVLHQRGFLVLHASAIEIDGSAIAFLAEKGTGKSTLAAAFHAAGHMLVADDIVPVDLQAPAGPLVYPGFPQLKLFPEAAEQLGPADDLPRLLPNYEKRARRLSSPFSAEPLPLRALYVLSDGDCERIATLSAREGFMSLVRHSFVLPLLRATSTEGAHFRQSTALLKLAPVRSLQRRRSLTLLPAVVKMVEDNLAGK